MHAPMETRSTSEAAASDSSGAVVATISRQIVKIYSEYFGRGPTKAKTFMRDDLVVCVLGDVFTRAEQLLVDAGRFPQVREHRQAFQDEVEPIFRAVIEEIAGRQVQAFLSQVSKDGVAVEVFILEPDSSPV
jgi:uncharacterized protein YbcI